MRAPIALAYVGAENRLPSIFMITVGRSASASFGASRRVQALIIQNANAYKEGLGAKWASIARYWADPNAHPDVFDAFVSPAAAEFITEPKPKYGETRCYIRDQRTLGIDHPIALAQFWW